MDADEILLGFSRALRAAGVAVTPDREETFLRSCALVGMDDQRGVHAAGRATLCAGPDDLERFDRVFTAWFSGQPAGLAERSPSPRVSPQAGLDGAGPDGAGEQDEAVHAAASTTEVLRHRDIAELSAAERAYLAGLFATLNPRVPTRPHRRHTRSRRGEVDAPATLRAQLRRLGEPGEIAWRRRAVRDRRVVLLIDVSGSMAPYADALLRLAHRYVLASRSSEVFTLGTRLTHVTRALRHRDPDRAIAAAGSVVPDWSGGTRLGQGIAAFLDRWGRRGMARGATVVVFSDGWEREAPEQLGEQMRRLHALAHSVVWVNPHRGKAGYLPVQSGIVAVLPHLDHFVAGHSMAAFTELTEVVAHA
ncbi:MAG: VWA domain-containing protein [Micrococcales bacterium]|nr:VWA domain-containing protein [Micrococcales bacterium]